MPQVVQADIGESRPATDPGPRVQRDERANEQKPAPTIHRRPLTCGQCDRRADETTNMRQGSGGNTLTVESLLTRTTMPAYLYERNE